MYDLLIDPKILAHQNADEDEVDDAAAAGSNRKSRSECWLYFAKETWTKLEKTAYCQLCQKKGKESPPIVCGTTGTITPMWRHLEKFHSEVFKKTEKAKKDLEEKEKEKAKSKTETKMKMKKLLGIGGASGSVFFHQFFVFNFCRIKWLESWIPRNFAFYLSSSLFQLSSLSELLNMIPFEPFFDI